MLIRPSIEKLKLLSKNYDPKVIKTAKLETYKTYKNSIERLMDASTLTSNAAIKSMKLGLPSPVSKKAEKKAKQKTKKQFNIQEKKKEIENLKLYHNWYEEHFQTLKSKIKNLDKNEGFVYLLGNSAFKGWYKIGSTKNFIKRLSAYQTSAPYEYKFLYVFCIRNETSCETFIHNTLKNYRKKGEWYQISLEDVLITIRKAETLAF